MLVFVLNQTQKANTGKIQTPVYENVREFGGQIRCGIFVPSAAFLRRLEEEIELCSFDQVRKRLLSVSKNNTLVIHKT